MVEHQGVTRLSARLGVDHLVHLAHSSDRFWAVRTSVCVCLFLCLGQIKYSNQYTKLPSGLIIYDFNYGKNDGPTPQDGQKVIFHYTAYNENGARIDTSYNGKRPLEQVVGIGGMVPGCDSVLARLTLS